MNGSTRNERVESEVERTLASLDDLGELTPNPYLYARVIQQLDMRDGRTRGGVRGHLRWAEAALALLVVLNILSASALKAFDQPPAPAAPSAAEQWAREYRITGSALSLPGVGE